MQRLCYRPHKLLLIFAVFTNILMLIYLAYLQDQLYFVQEHSQHCANQSIPRVVTHSIAIVIREFEEFDNDLPHLITNIVENFDDDVSVFIIADKKPYPPLQLVESPRIHTLILSTDIQVPYEANLLNRISSEYILIVPDGVQLTNKSRNYIMDILWDWSSLREHPETKMLAWAVGNTEVPQCLGLNVKLREWTLQYYSSSEPCDALRGGSFVLGIKREHLLLLASPFARPMDEAFFIQTATKGWKIALYKTRLWTSHKKLHTDPHSSWKQAGLRKQRISKVYKDFDIKLVQQPDGAEQQFGCSKDTERCFGSIHNDMPDYLYRGRWTPPCCLQAIRITARHVFRILESQNIRYWLEGGSLLGAARNGDIIPWDFDVDIGVYQEDAVKCLYLRNALQEPYEDEDGFIWEKAPEGEFFRVQYSAVNRLHVDIFPFYPVNGTMTKKTWFQSHRQDMPFPEHFLKPLVKMNFVGTEAYAPNNWEKFIDLKFGKGAINSPKYPDASGVKM